MQYLCNIFFGYLHPKQNDTWIVPYNIHFLKDFIPSGAQSEGSAPQISPPSVLPLT